MINYVDTWLKTEKLYLKPRCLEFNTKVFKLRTKLDEWLWSEYKIGELS